METTRLLLTGDFVINHRDYSTDRIEGRLVELFKSSDFNITNLECPVTTANNEYKIIKTGPHLKGEEEIIGETFTSLNINLVTLANNHILDYGEKGLKDTLRFCQKNDIEYVGAGTSLSEAKRVYRKNINGHHISIINFAENEWASATENTAGANPMDIIENVKQIQKTKKTSDLVIVIIHGGHEYFDLPSPRMVKQYRFYADSGADLIVGHHAHCISGFEIYGETPIYYGLGNLLFTKTSMFSGWYKGLVLEVVVNSDRKIDTIIHPVQQDQNNHSLSLLIGDEKDIVLKQVDETSKIIQSESQLQTAWNNLIEEKYNDYLTYWSPLLFFKSKLLKALIVKSGLNRRLINKTGLSLALNLMRCEAHADLSKATIDKYLKKK